MRTTRHPPLRWCQRRLEQRKIGGERKDGLAGDPTRQLRGKWRNRSSVSGAAISNMENSVGYWALDVYRSVVYGLVRSSSR